MKKVALITGANRGLGFEIARQLGRRGWRILLGARDRERGETAAAELAAAGIDASFVRMDVSNPSSIHVAFNELQQSGQSLDVLINNAGILLREDRNLLTAPAGMIGEVLQTNAVGSLQVVQTFLPLLRRGSRVLFMSSGGGSMTDPVGGWSPVYCLSKTLMNGIVRQLAYALRDKGITVNAVCPGWVRTAMGGASAPLPVERGAETAVWLADEAPGDKTGLFWRDKRVIPW